MNYSFGNHLDQIMVESGARHRALFRPGWTAAPSEPGDTMRNGRSRSMTGRNAALAAALALAALPALAEDAATNFDAGWDDPDWTFSIEQDREADRRIGGDDAPATEPGGPALRWGGSDVEFAPVAGAHGAKITPQGSNVQLGVGLAPLEAVDPQAVPGFGPTPESDPFGDIANGFAGALSVSETQGSVTHSMSLSTPLSETAGTEVGGRKVSDEVRTMFGLGYNF